MKRSILIMSFALCGFGVFGQKTDSIQINKTELPAVNKVKTVTIGQEAIKHPQNAAINLGVLMGGGSLIGADLECLVIPRLGLEAGLGISSYGFALNYHLKDIINSSFISFQYWHQGFGSSHFASYAGPMFVFRAKKIFQAGIGFAAVVDRGPLYSLNTNFILLYNIGIYFPL